MESRPRVVITGVGAVAPKNIGTSTFWSNLLQGKSGIDRITSIDVSGLKCQIGGEITGFDPISYLRAGTKLNRYGKNVGFGLVAAAFAVEDALLAEEALASAGLLIGVTGGPLDIMAKHVPRPAPSPSFVHAASANSVATVIGSYFGLAGSSLTASTACAAGLEAVGLAYERIQSGKEKVIICGGSDSAISHHPFVDFEACGMLSTRNDTPSKASRPFDRERDGGLASEGAGMLIFEDYRHALARRARIYGEVKGIGTSVDPKGGEHGSGLVESMREALANASLMPKRIQYVNAHGPSDRDMDRIETEAIKVVFGNHAKSLMVSSIKGMTGNPLAAAGALQMVAASLCLAHRIVPPTANYEFPDPLCDLDYVPTARQVYPEHILVNSHGVGGGNVSLVLGRPSK